MSKIELIQVKSVVLYYVLTSAKQLQGE